MTSYFLASVLALSFAVFLARKYFVGNKKFNNTNTVQQKYKQTKPNNVREGHNNASKIQKVSSRKKIQNFQISFVFFNNAFSFFFPFFPLFFGRIFRFPNFLFDRKTLACRSHLTFNSSLLQLLYNLYATCHKPHATCRLLLATCGKWPTKGPWMNMHDNQMAMLRSTRSSPPSSHSFPHPAPHAPPKDINAGYAHGT